jgi:hypothetical protein
MAINYKQFVEKVSTLAILLSVVFLALEVSQSNQLAKSTIRQALNVSDMELWKIMLEEGVIAKSLFKMDNNLKLTKYEHYQVELFQTVNFRDYDNSFYHYSNGLFEEDVWLMYRNAIKQLLLRNNSVRKMWEKHNSEFSNEFQIEVNKIINELKVEENEIID